MSYYRKKSRGGIVLFLLFLLLLSAAINFYYLWPKSKAGLIISGKKENYGVYCAGEAKADSCYWFDKEGVIWNEARVIVGESILKIEEVSDFKAARGAPILTGNLTDNFIAIFDFLRSDYLKAEKVVLERESQELEVSAFYEPTGLKTRILFNLRFDPKNNLAGLTTFLNKYKPKVLEYIDLRVENKIFYK